MKSRVGLDPNSDISRVGSTICCRVRSRDWSNTQATRPINSAFSCRLDEFSGRNKRLVRLLNKYCRKFSMQRGRSICRLDMNGSAEVASSSGGTIPFEQFWDEHWRFLGSMRGFHRLISSFTYSIIYNIMADIVCERTAYKMLTYNLKAQTSKSWMIFDRSQEAFETSNIRRMVYDRYGKWYMVKW